MNKIVLVTMLVAISAAKSVLGMDTPIFYSPVSFYTKKDLEKLIVESELPVKGKDPLKVKMAKAALPFNHGTTEPRVPIYPIDVKSSTLEKNGFQILDFSNDAVFVNLLKEFGDLKFPRDENKAIDLKKRYSRKLTDLINEWLKNTESTFYKNAKLTLWDSSFPIRRTEVTEEDKNLRPTVPFLHIDAWNENETERVYRLLNQFPESTNIIDSLNIWAHTDVPHCGGSPLALVDASTVTADDSSPILTVKADGQFVSKAFHFDINRHKLLTVEQWWLGYVAIFRTPFVPHTAVKKNNDPRSSVETRGYLTR